MEELRAGRNRGGAAAPLVCGPAALKHGREHALYTTAPPPARPSATALPVRSHPIRNTVPARAYKILFLDVLFPLGVDRVIFVDSDQVVRADLRELMDLDLKARAAVCCAHACCLGRGGRALDHAPRP